MTTTGDGALRSLNLQWKPVAIGFMSVPPAFLPRVDRSLPAGCAYWKYASEGHAFYTTPEDHFNCPVGAFTHGVILPATQQTELEGLIGTMIKLEYLQGDEVASLPHRTEPLRIAAYASGPLASLASPCSMNPRPTIRRNGIGVHRAIGNRPDKSNAMLRKKCLGSAIGLRVMFIFNSP